MDGSLILIICAFVSVAFMAYFVTTQVFTGNDGNKLRSRLQGKSQPDSGRQGRSSQYISIHG